MKTNVGIELTDEERINLGQKYHGKNKPVTRADINKIVLDYIKNVLNARPHTIQEKQDEPMFNKRWSSLESFKQHLISTGEHEVLEYNGFELKTKNKNGRVETFYLALGTIYTGTQLKDEKRLAI